MIDLAQDKVLDRVSDLAEIELSYIATVNFTEPTIGMTCKHGAKECLANIHQLCVKEAYPDHRVWFQCVLAVHFERPNADIVAQRLYQLCQLGTGSAHRRREGGEGVCEAGGHRLGTRRRALRRS